MKHGSETKQLKEQLTRSKRRVYQMKIRSENVLQIIVAAAILDFVSRNVLRCLVTGWNFASESILRVPNVENLNIDQTMKWLKELLIR